MPVKHCKLVVNAIHQVVHLAFPFGGLISIPLPACLSACLQALARECKLPAQSSLAGPEGNQLSAVMATRVPGKREESSYRPSGYVLASEHHFMSLIHFDERVRHFSKASNGLSKPLCDKEQEASSQDIGICLNGAPKAKSQFLWEAECTPLAAFYPDEGLGATPALLRLLVPYPSSYLPSRCLALFCQSIPDQCDRFFRENFYL